MDKGPQKMTLALPVHRKSTLIILGVFVLAFGLPSFLFSQQIKAVEVKTDSSQQTLRTDTLHPVVAEPDTQKIDSTDILKEQRAKLHSPKKAVFLSAVLPGLGQAYNKKYWKIPIIYAGFGGLGYALYYTSTNFQGYRNAYRQQEATTPNRFASYNGVSDAATLKAYRDYFKKYLDISAIGVGVWYLLNLVDAAVDAHLMNWNMKDDLSVSWHPTVIPGAPNYTSAAAGISLAFHF